MSLITQLTEDKKRMSNNLRDVMRFQNETSTQETILKDHNLLLEAKVKDLQSQNLKLVSRLLSFEEESS